MASRRGSLALVVLCSVLVLAPHGAAKKPRLVPAMFVFGDSLVDVGNNNHLAQCNLSCKANYAPYGIDLPCRSPTGRFSNGYNMADQLAQLLGFAKSPPPFLSLSNASVYQRMSTGGINFASGGSGLLPETGFNTCGEVIPMSEQVGNFTSLVRRRSGSGRDRTAADLISKSLIFISVGSNDLFEYADNFTQANVSDPSRNDTEFLQRLIASYTGYVKDLYAAGATKFSVLSPSLVGCCPFQRAVAKKFNGSEQQSGCLGLANNLSRQLHPMIASMLQDLSLELPGMNYSLGDAIEMAEFVFKRPRTRDYNFTTLDLPCCALGEFGEGMCNTWVTLCQNRSSYFFWDRFHPTDAASAITANELFNDTGHFVSPINVQQLVAPGPRP
ncbi:hypothetical protein SETIT_7G198400v2 [Setaria italica]|uniref:GDSL esterase/lipase n=1 Tax=Setaria italica TaxID=4555 RepID=K3YC49_SETIT|nr:GDSL esterase/lipase At4g16230 [Setaria italica]RCV34937.1 hypothetical protein SETIT_7G198400v2 [Setaria italica]